MIRNAGTSTHQNPVFGSRMTETTQVAARAHPTEAGGYLPRLSNQETSMPTMNVIGPQSKNQKTISLVTFAEEAFPKPESASPKTPCRQPRTSSCLASQLPARTCSTAI